MCLPLQLNLRYHPKSPSDLSLSSLMSFLGDKHCQPKGIIQAALHRDLLWVTAGCTGRENCGKPWILGSLSHYLPS